MNRKLHIPPAVLRWLACCVFLMGASLGAQPGNLPRWTPEELSVLFRTLDGTPVPRLKEQLGQWIESETDTAARRLIVTEAFSHYASSPVMGYENVALFLADRYLLNRRIPCPEEFRMEAAWFARTNRENSLGRPAPVLELQQPDGTGLRTDTLPGKYRLLFFYDDQCPVCRMEYDNLRVWSDSLARTDARFSLSILRIYTGSDRRAWDRYRKQHPLLQSDSVRLFEAWDPEFLSDYPTRYGVVSTPMLYLADTAGTLIGRRLHTSNLFEIIRLREGDGGFRQEMRKFFSQVFAQAVNPGTTTPEDSSLVNYAIDRIYRNCSADPELFRSLFYELYQFLKTSPEYSLQRGAAYLGEQYICGQPERWLGHSYAGVTFDPDFIEQTCFAAAMFRRNPLGEPAADLLLTALDGSPCTLYDTGRRYTVLYFYKTDCSSCEIFSDELERIASDFPDSGLSWTAVCTDRKTRDWKRYALRHLDGWHHLADPEGTSGMFERYNLSGVPALYLLDEEMRVLAKDISPLTLEKLLKAIYPN